jgi:outer membrane protein OmpA-like peptidoglycan-associated protein
MIKKNMLFFFLSALIFSGPSIWANEFLYKFRAGDKFRIISTVNQDIYVDRVLSFRAEIINRIAMEVVDLTTGEPHSTDSGAGTAERARLSATFQSAEKTVPVNGNEAANLFHWSRDYRSEFEQNTLGFMTVGEQYFKPMVRDLPVFPGRVLYPGDTWSAEGTEVHDFSDNFGIAEPYRISFTANYTYLGERIWNEITYPAFSVSYRIFLEPEPVPGIVFPRRIQGASDLIIYWDTGLGQVTAYEEYFRTIISLSNGQTWEYRGRASAELIEAPPMDKEEMARDIAEEIADIPDATVRVTDEGIVISLENIQFAPDSAVLRPSEWHKLDMVAEILLRYPERDIMVGGHTALAGTFEGRQRISLERAASVAEYLLSKDVRTPDRVIIQGFGAEQPIADNRTTEGMARNRRVEIIILEN